MLLLSNFMKFYVTPKNTLYFGLDHLEMYWTFYDETCFDGIDFDNSNYGTHGLFTFTKHEVPRYAYKMSFSQNDHPMFAFYKWKTTGSVTTKDYFCFYSTLFRTHTMEEITELLYAYFRFWTDTSRKKAKSPLRRFDICLDLLIPIDSLLRFFTSSSQKWATFRGQWGETETLYIWDKKKTQNKRQLIRIYDKKKDIMAKRKDALYQDYLIESHVTRIELEVRRELTRNYTYEELLLPENLFGLLKNYLEKHTSIFDKLNIEGVSLYRPREVNFNMIQANAEWRKIVSTYIGWSRNMLKRWICPTYILLRKNIMHRDTRGLFLETPWFAPIIEEIEHSHQKWKEIVESIKNWKDDSDKWM